MLGNGNVCSNVGKTGQYLPEERLSCIKFYRCWTHVDAETLVILFLVHHSCSRLIHFNKSFTLRFGSVYERVVTNVQELTSVRT